MSPRRFTEVSLLIATVLWPDVAMPAKTGPLKFEPVCAVNDAVQDRVPNCVRSDAG
jgi:hypothetical protein